MDRLHPSADLDTTQYPSLGGKTVQPHPTHLPPSSASWKQSLLNPPPLRVAPPPPHIECRPSTSSSTGAQQRPPAPSSKPSPKVKAKRTNNFQHAVGDKGISIGQKKGKEGQDNVLSKQRHASTETNSKLESTSNAESPTKSSLKIQQRHSLAPSKNPAMSRSKEILDIAKEKSTTNTKKKDELGKDIVRSNIHFKSAELNPTPPVPPRAGPKASAAVGSDQNNIFRDLDGSDDDNEEDVRSGGNMIYEGVDVDAVAIAVQGWSIQILKALEKQNVWYVNVLRGNPFNCPSSTKVVPRGLTKESFTELLIEALKKDETFRYIAKYKGSTKDVFMLKENEQRSDQVLEDALTDHLGAEYVLEQVRRAYSQVCANCSSEKTLLVCSSCKCAAYCSSQCFSAQLMMHKSLCPMLPWRRTEYENLKQYCFGQRAMITKDFPPKHPFTVQYGNSRYITGVIKRSWVESTGLLNDYILYVDMWLPVRSKFTNMKTEVKLIEKLSFPDPSCLKRIFLRGDLVELVNCYHPRIKDLGEVCDVRDTFDDVHDIQLNGKKRVMKQVQSSFLILLDYTSPQWKLFREVESSSRPRSAADMALEGDKIRYCLSHSLILVCRAPEFYIAVDERNFALQSFDDNSLYFIHKDQHILDLSVAAHFLDISKQFMSAEAHQHLCNDIESVNHLKCATCGAMDKKLALCSKCNTAKYCSVDCQKSGWPSHKMVCSQLSKAYAVEMQAKSLNNIDMLFCAGQAVDITLSKELCLKLNISDRQISGSVSSHPIYQNPVVDRVLYQVSVHFLNAQNKICTELFRVASLTRIFTAGDIVRFLPVDKRYFEAGRQQQILSKISSNLLDGLLWIAEVYCRNENGTYDIILDSDGKKEQNVPVDFLFRYDQLSVGWDAQRLHKAHRIREGADGLRQGDEVIFNSEVQYVYAVVRGVAKMTLCTKTAENMDKMLALTREKDVINMGVLADDIIVPPFGNTSSIVSAESYGKNEVEYTLQGRCALCGLKASDRCSRCKSALFCSVTCSKPAWQFHKATCSTLPMLCGMKHRTITLACLKRALACGQSVLCNQYPDYGFCVAGKDREHHDSVGPTTGKVILVPKGSHEWDHPRLLEVDSISCTPVFAVGDIVLFVPPKYRLYYDMSSGVCVHLPNIEECWGNLQMAEVCRPTSRESDYLTCDIIIDDTGEVVENVHFSYLYRYDAFAPETWNPNRLKKAIRPREGDGVRQGDEIYLTDSGESGVVYAVPHVNYPLVMIGNTSKPMKETELLKRTRFGCFPYFINKTLEKERATATETFERDVHQPPTSKSKKGKAKAAAKAKAKLLESAISEWLTKLKEATTIFNSKSSPIFLHELLIAPCGEEFRSHCLQDLFASHVCDIVFSAQHPGIVISAAVDETTDSTPAVTTSSSGANTIYERNDVKAPNDPPPNAALMLQQSYFLPLEDVNTLCKGQTAFHIAATTKNLAAVQMLLDHGVFPNVRNDSNLFPDEILGEQLHQVPEEHKEIFSLLYEARLSAEALQRAADKKAKLKAKKDLKRAAKAAAAKVDENEKGLNCDYYDEAALEDEVTDRLDEETTDFGAAGVTVLEEPLTKLVRCAVKALRMRRRSIASVPKATDVQVGSNLPDDPPSSEVHPSVLVDRIPCTELISETKETSSEPPAFAPALPPVVDAAAVSSQSAAGDDEFGFGQALWELEITKEARLQWQLLEFADRRLVASKLQLLAHGRWANQVRSTQHDGDLKLFRTNFSKGGRIIWERAITYSAVLSCYCEVIRVWGIVADHDKQSATIHKIQESHRKGRTCNVKKSMVPRNWKNMNSKIERDQDGTQLEYPQLFDEASRKSQSISDTSSQLSAGLSSITTTITGRPTSDDATASASSVGDSGDSLYWYPPAVPSADSYVLLKFYECTAGLLRRYCAEIEEDPAAADFPFRLSPLEHAVCDLHPSPPSSVLLLGRSGTGKTTCLGFRMWFHYRAWYEEFCQGGSDHRLLNGGTHSLNQVFLTANPVLRSEVKKFFHSLREGDRKKASDTRNSNSRSTNTNRGTDVTVAGSAVGAATVTSSSATAYTSDVPELPLKLECGLDTPTLAQSKPEDKFPLFLTKREWLVLLDGTLKSPFFRRLPGPGAELAPAVADKAWGRQETEGIFQLSECFLEDEDDEDEDEDGEVTSNRNNTVSSSSAAYAANATENGRGKKKASKKNTNNISVEGSSTNQPLVEVDFDYFSSKLWPQLSIDGQRQYSASLLWCEFTSFIKGSAESMHTGVLSEAQYMDIGKKRAPNFRGNRPVIYKLFLEYEKLRRRVNGFDLCDLVYHIFHELQVQREQHKLSGACAEDYGAGDSATAAASYTTAAGFNSLSHDGSGYTGVPLHEMFVDEIQDFMESEVMLMITVADPNRLFLTGDDAQTIARGLSFRFADIRSLFWRYSQENSSVGVPEIYKLTNNYRAHSGILNLANCIIDLIWRFFPGTVDKLPHDRGLFDGPKPWLLQAAKFEDLCVLLLGSDRDSQIEFGAQQCVIVRDAESKRNIPDELSRGGIVCSVFESKGLEFNDVLLYNFFTDSPAKGMWRVVMSALDDFSAESTTSSTPDSAAFDSGHGLAMAASENYLTCQAVESSTDKSNKSAPDTDKNAATNSHQYEEKRLEQAQEQRPKVSKPGWIRPLEFDETQHKILLEELRHLYTAITRARVNIWIYDECEEFRSPMFELFKAKNLVRVIDRVLDLTELKITKGALTSQEEWITQGRNLFDKGAFQLAHTCFSKGKDEERAANALAHALARAPLPSSSQPTASSFSNPGTFSAESAAEERESVEDTRARFRTAAELFLVGAGLQDDTNLGKEEGNTADNNPQHLEGLLEAAICLKRSQEYRLAAQLFEAMGKTKQAAWCLQHTGEDYLEAGELFISAGKLKSAIASFLKCSKAEDIITGASSVLKKLPGKAGRNKAAEMLVTAKQFAAAMNVLDFGHPKPTEGDKKAFVQLQQPLPVQSNAMLLQSEDGPPIAPPDENNMAYLSTVDVVDVAIAAAKHSLRLGESTEQVHVWLDRIPATSWFKAEKVMRDTMSFDVFGKHRILNQTSSQSEILNAVAMLCEKSLYKQTAEFLQLRISKEESVLKLKDKVTSTSTHAHAAAAAAVTPPPSSSATAINIAVLHKWRARCLRADGSLRAARDAFESAGDPLGAFCISVDLLISDAVNSNGLVGDSRAIIINNLKDLLKSNLKTPGHMKAHKYSRNFGWGIYYLVNSAIKCGIKVHDLLPDHELLFQALAAVKYAVMSFSSGRTANTTASTNKTNTAASSSSAELASVSAISAVGKEPKKIIPVDGKSAATSSSSKNNNYKDNRIVSSSADTSASSAFFEFEPSTLKPGFARFDRMATRLQSMIAGRLHAKPESVGSGFQLCCPWDDLHKMIVFTVCHTVCVEWQLGQYFVEKFTASVLDQEDTSAALLCHKHQMAQALNVLVTWLCLLQSNKVPPINAIVASRKNCINTVQEQLKDLQRVVAESVLKVLKMRLWSITNVGSNNNNKLFSYSLYEGLVDIPTGCREAFKSHYGGSEPSALLKECEALITDHSDTLYKGGHQENTPSALNEKIVLLHFIREMSSGMHTSAVMSVSYNPFDTLNECTQKYIEELGRKRNSETYQDASRGAAYYLYLTMLAAKNHLPPLSDVLKSHEYRAQNSSTSSATTTSPSPSPSSSSASAVQRCSHLAKFLWQMLHEAKDGMPTVPLWQSPFTATILSEITAVAVFSLGIACDSRVLLPQSYAIGILASVFGWYSCPGITVHSDVKALAPHAEHQCSSKQGSRYVRKLTTKVKRIDMDNHWEDIKKLLRDILDLFSKTALDLSDSESSSPGHELVQKCLETAIFTLQFNISEAVESVRLQQQQNQQSSSTLSASEKQRDLTTVASNLALLVRKWNEFADSTKYVRARIFKPQQEVATVPQHIASLDIEEHVGAAAPKFKKWNGALISSTEQADLSIVASTTYCYNQDMLLMLDRLRPNNNLLLLCPARLGRSHHHERNNREQQQQKEQQLQQQQQQQQSQEYNARHAAVTIQRLFRGSSCRRVLASKTAVSNHVGRIAVASAASVSGFAAAAAPGADADAASNDVRNITAGTSTAATPDDRYPEAQKRWYFHIFSCLFESLNVQLQSNIDFSDHVWRHFAVLDATGFNKYAQQSTLSPSASSFNPYYTPVTQQIPFTTEQQSTALVRGIYDFCHQTAEQLARLEVLRDGPITELLEFLYSTEDNKVDSSSTASGVIRVSTFEEAEAVHGSKQNDDYDEEHVMYTITGKKQTVVTVSQTVHTFVERINQIIEEVPETVRCCLQHGGIQYARNKLYSALPELFDKGLWHDFCIHYCAEALDVIGRDHNGDHNGHTSSSSSSSSSSSGANNDGGRRFAMVADDEEDDDDEDEDERGFTKVVGGRSYRRRKKANKDGDSGGDGGGARLGGTSRRQNLNSQLRYRQLKQINRVTAASK